MTLREAVGQCFIVGVGGAELSAEEAAWLRLLQPGGVILFARNIVSAEQTRALLDAAQEEVRTPLFCCVDLEGGSVDRLRTPLAPTPSVAAVAATRSRRNARTHGRLIGEAVSLFGFNVTFAPVLDLGLPDSAHVMGARTAGATAREVVAYAEPFLRGLRDENVLGCGKHFPGLGGGTLDSHLQLPRIRRTREQMQEDMLPYRDLRRDLPMVMVSHAAYPAITGDDEPASLSRWWIETILRGKIGYRGLVVSDDLEMQAVLTRGIEAVALDAMEAGADMALICHKPELILRGYESVLRAAEHSKALREQVSASKKRIAKAKKAIPARSKLSANHAAGLKIKMQAFARAIGLLA